MKTKEVDTITKEVATITNELATITKKFAIVTKNQDPAVLHISRHCWSQRGKTTLYFLKVYFPKLYFPKVYFSKCFPPMFIFSKVHVLKVYFFQ